MNEGNSAVADPVTTGQSDIQSSQQGVTEGQNEGGQNGEAKPARNLEVELATIQERYKNSSQEAHRLVDEVKELRQRLDKQERQGSLTTHAPAQFPDEQRYVEYWMNEGEKTEKEAKAEYRREKAYFDDRQIILSQIAAQQNIMRLEAEQRERGYINIDPTSKEANEFFKDIPEIDSLPIADKVDRYKAMKTKLAPKSDGRDLSSIKSAAGGVAGGGAMRSDPSSASNLDSQAKLGGWKNWQQVEDAKKCTTQAEFDAYRKKYPKSK